MVSLAIWITVLLLVLSLGAVVLTFGAKVVRAERAMVWAGFKAALLTLLATACVGAITLLVLPSPEDPTTTTPRYGDPAFGQTSPRGPSVAETILISGAGFAAQLALMWLICARCFHPRRRSHAWVPVGLHIGLAALLMVAMQYAFRPYVSEAYRQPAANMAPELEVGDRFNAVKFLEPARWDVITYWKTVDYTETGQPGRVVYDSRLIAMPGERLRFEAGQVYINDAPVMPPEHMAGKYTAELPLPFRDNRYRDGETIVLGPDEYFIVSDNLERAVDSRWEGPIVREDLIGVVDLRYWPPGRFEVLR